MPRPFTPRTAPQLQPIHALRLRLRRPVRFASSSCGSMNIRDVRDRRRQTDVRQHHCLMHPPRGRGHDNPTQRKTNIQNKHTDHTHFIASPLVGTRRQSQNHRLPFHSETTETSSKDWLRVSSKSVSGYWNRSQKGRLMLCFVDRLCPKVRCLDHR